MVAGNIIDYYDEATEEEKPENQNILLSSVYQFFEGFYSFILKSSSANEIYKLASEMTKQFSESNLPSECKDIKTRQDNIFSRLQLLMNS